MSQAKEYLSWWRGLDEGGGALGHVLQPAEGQDPAVRPTGRAWDGLPLEMGEGGPDSEERKGPQWLGTSRATQMPGEAEARVLGPSEGAGGRRPGE